MKSLQLQPEWALRHRNINNRTLDLTRHILHRANLVQRERSQRSPTRSCSTSTVSTAFAAQAFSKRWGNHSSFKTGTIDRSGFPTFTVSHFNGPVTYSSGFLDRNLDAINPDFVSLLRGGLAPTIPLSRAFSRQRRLPSRHIRATRTPLSRLSKLSSPCGRRRRAERTVQTHAYCQGECRR